MTHLIGAAKSPFFRDRSMKGEAQDPYLAGLGRHMQADLDHISFIATKD